jgi:2-amino-4-hydroxy-6-hydroxymethyldihydropteridine diphosphokinase
LTGGERFAVALGSNLGDRAANLRLGLRAVATHATDLVVSAVYETAPVYCEAQEPFLNACCIGRTRLTPRQLLSDLQDAERRAGRRRGGPRFGPRELDLDVLLYADLVQVGDRLTIPHPRLGERAFVLIPLAEIAGDWIIPAAGERGAVTVGELAKAVGSVGIIRTELEL